MNALDFVIPLAGLFLVALIVMATFLLARNNGRKKTALRWPRTAEPEPALHDENDEPAGDTLASFYERIRARTRLHPGEPIDYRDFPAVLTEHEGITYRPGARDMLIREGEDNRWKQVVKAVQAIGAGEIADWRMLEREVCPVEPAAYQAQVLKGLRSVMFDGFVRDLFAEMARRSSDYAAVKWGITIAGAGASLNEMKLLLPLARHSEFTSYICSGLQRGGRKDATFTLLFRELVDMTEGWGLYHAIAHTAQSLRLRDDWQLQRSCVIRGMQRGDGARGYIAEIIMREMDPMDLLNRAAADPELATAMLELLESLVWTPEPPGMLADLDEGKRLITRYIDWLELLPPDIETLRALRSLAIALATEELQWEGREELFQRTRILFLQHLDSDVVAEAIRADRFREIALQIIVELGLNDLAPVVLEDYRKRPSALNIDVLGHIGEGEHLQILFELLPDRGTLLERSLVARDAVITGDLHNTSAMYAAALRHMGRLQRPEAIGSIKAAAADFHPWVRSAAMYAMSNMQRWTLDTECKGLVRACLTDSHDFVREGARQTAIYHNLNASINGLAGSAAGEDVGVSLN